LANYNSLLKNSRGEPKLNDPDVKALMKPIWDFLKTTDDEFRNGLELNRLYKVLFVEFSAELSKKEQAKTAQNILDNDHSGHAAAKNPELEALIKAAGEKVRPESPVSVEKDTTSSEDTASETGSDQSHLDQMPKRYLFDQNLQPMTHDELNHLKAGLIDPVDPTLKAAVLTQDEEKIKNRVLLAIEYAAIHKEASFRFNNKHHLSAHIFKAFIEQYTSQNAHWATPDQVKHFYAVYYAMEDLQNDPGLAQKLGLSRLYHNYFDGLQELKKDAKHWDEIINLITS
jgi:hypothetical protein